MAAINEPGMLSPVISERSKPTAGGELALHHPASSFPTDFISNPVT